MKCPICGGEMQEGSVSYTHLDVYKRQAEHFGGEDGVLPGCGNQIPFRL